MYTYLQTRSFGMLVYFLVPKFLIAIVLKSYHRFEQCSCLMNNLCTNLFQLYIHCKKFEPYSFFVLAYNVQWLVPHVGKQSRTALFQNCETLPLTTLNLNQSRCSVKRDSHTHMESSCSYSYSCSWCSYFPCWVH